jgi:hypothetical protein
MSCHFYLVRYENKLYANSELYIAAIKKGEKALIKLLSSKVITSKLLMDQTLYPLTPAELTVCETYNPIVQDFDEALRHFNVVSKETLGEIKEHESEAFPDAVIINIKRETIPEVFKYRHITFFKVMDYRECQKYHMLPKMAAIKICGRLYAAFNTVDMRVEKGAIIASLVN